jgi:NAD(P)-dependent dehydrogenase (short-subunit alcohol dehydrogenase family)
MTSEMRRVVVTGGNKGIGLAIVTKALTDTADVFVYLGARDLNRGTAAVQALIEANPSWHDRLDVLLVDPTSAASVATAAARLEATGLPLYGIVNNAGAFLPLPEMLDLHLYGPRRVTEALVGLLLPGGRVVNVSSGGAPACVVKSRSDRRQLLASPDLTWTQIDALAQEVVALVAALPHSSDDAAVSQATGISWSLGGYGFTKALLNCYTAWLQREHSTLVINAVNPGFIHTDLSQPFLGDRAPAEAGMRPVAEGALAPCELLLGAGPAARGQYHESDGTAQAFDAVNPNDFDEAQ